MKANPLVDLPNDLEGFLNRFVYVVEDDRVCDLALPPHAAIMKKNEFFGLTSSAWINITVIDGRNGESNDKSVPANKHWMADPATKMLPSRP